MDAVLPARLKRASLVMGMVQGHAMNCAMEIGCTPCHVMRLQLVVLLTALKFNLDALAQERLVGAVRYVARGYS